MSQAMSRGGGGGKCAWGWLTLALRQGNPQPGTHCLLHGGFQVHLVSIYPEGSIEAFRQALSIQNVLKHGPVFMERMRNMEDEELQTMYPKFPMHRNTKEHSRSTDIFFPAKMHMSELLSQPPDHVCIITTDK